MRALEVSVNGHIACIAGVGDHGLVNAIVNCSTDLGRDDIDLMVGGLNTETDEHTHWPTTTLGVGSEVLIRVIETVATDPPRERVRFEKETCVSEFRRNLEELSGWLSPDERRQVIRELLAELENMETGSDAFNE
jgi:hypothetical protein